MSFHAAHDAACSAGDSRDRGFPTGPLPGLLPKPPQGEVIMRDGPLLACLTVLVAAVMARFADDAPAASRFGHWKKPSTSFIQKSPPTADTCSNTRPT